MGSNISTPDTTIDTVPTDTMPVVVPPSDPMIRAQFLKDLEESDDNTLYRTQANMYFNEVYAIFLDEVRRNPEENEIYISYGQMPGHLHSNTKIKLADMLTRGSDGIYICRYIPLHMYMPHAYEGGISCERVQQNLI